MNPKNQYIFHSCRFNTSTVPLQHALSPPSPPPTPPPPPRAPRTHPNADIYMTSISLVPLMTQRMNPYKPERIPTLYPTSRGLFHDGSPTVNQLFARQSLNPYSTPLGTTTVTSTHLRVMHIGRLLLEAAMPRGERTGAPVPASPAYVR